MGKKWELCNNYRENSRDNHHFGYPMKTEACRLLSVGLSSGRLIVGCRVRNPVAAGHPYEVTVKQTGCAISRTIYSSFTWTANL